MNQMETLVPREEAVRSTQSRPTMAGIDADLHRQSARRLGAVALVFGLGSVLAHASFVLVDTLAGHADRNLFMDGVIGINGLLGIGVYLWSRRGRISVERFPHVAFAFQVLTGALISLADWGWEQQRAAEMIEIAGALGIAAADLGPRFVTPINDLGYSLLHIQGVPWLGVWVLFFPMLVPTTPRRTLWACITTALVGLGILGLSIAVHGVPDGIGPWLAAYLVGSTIALFLMVLSAYFGSRVVYRLQRELSKAKRLGSYELVERIGAGGMGEVWRAQHRLLARPAAIKLIRREPTGHDDTRSSRTALLRFEREAQATAALSSPHTIEVYDFGITNEGDFYYVMELLHGFDLRTLVETHGPLVPERTVSFLRQACHSLWDAHLRGLTHRDIKPANLFVGTRLPEFDFIKVLDFGLVKEIEGGADMQLTATGSTTGTPAFMPPEMAQPGGGDARSDLYALGCVAYWLLTGSLVFEAPSGVLMLLKHVQETPVPPSQRSEMPIPPELDALVLQCLEKDPDARPQSAELLLHQLDSCAAHLPAWTQERARAWWETHAPDKLGLPLGPQV